MPAPKESDRPRPITDVIKEYLAWGRSGGGRGGRPWAHDHAERRQRHLDWWVSELGLKFTTDLIGSLSRVERSIQRLLAGTTRAPKTAWNYAEALVGLCNWCVDRDYFEVNPLRKLRKINTDPVNVRRAMTAEEVARLLSVVTPAHRLLIEVAVTTGLRAGELGRLTPLHLDVVRGGLHLDPEWTKNRKPGFQPLPRWLVEKLQRAAQGKQPTGSLLWVPQDTARMLNNDIRKAGIPKHVPGEGKLDFAALRTAFATMLDENGATAKESQTLARHATAALTMDRYIHAREGRMRNVVEALGNAIQTGHSPQQDTQREIGSETDFQNQLPLTALSQQ